MTERQARAKGPAHAHHAGHFFKGEKQTKDNHGMFNHDTSVIWMQKLLNDPKQRKIENAITVVDNAATTRKATLDPS